MTLRSPAFPQGVVVIVGQLSLKSQEHRHDATHPIKKTIVLCLPLDGVKSVTPGPLIFDKIN